MDKMKSKEMHLLFKTFICTILISSQAESSGYGSLAVPEVFFFSVKREFAHRDTYAL